MSYQSTSFSHISFAALIQSDVQPNFSSWPSKIGGGSLESRRSALKLEMEIEERDGDGLVDRHEMRATVSEVHATSSDLQRLPALR